VCSRRQYPPEVRRQLLELARAGRSLEFLAQEFEPSAQTIRNWIQQAARDTGQRTDGLTPPEALGADPSGAGAPAREGQAGDPVKRDGLVRQGDRHDPARVCGS
jgi:transposase